MNGSTSFSALGTTAVLVLTDAAALPLGRSLLADELDALELACSRFRDDSELSRANARAGEAVRVSPLLAAAVGVALDAARATGGLVTPALGEPLRSAGYDRTFRLVRAREQWTFVPVEPSADAWSRVVLDGDRLTVPPGVELDLGATAKALAADRAARAIAAAAGCGALVSLGGDLAVRGEPPAGGWCVRVDDDHAAPLDAPGPRVLVTDGGVATSSTAVRRWRTDRGEAHHVIDPRTALPARTPWRTVTVAARSCVDANVAATAAIVLGDDAPAWLTERGLPARLVAEDGGLAFTCGWPADTEAEAA